MPKYLMQAKYTPAGVRGLQKDGGVTRRAAVGEMVSSVGGRLEQFYFTMGNHDVIFIADLPDILVAKALSLAISSTGLASLEVISLLTAEDTDLVLRQIVTYHAPGEAGR